MGSYHKAHGQYINYMRAQRTKCQSPCTLEALAGNLSNLVDRAAQYYAGKAAPELPIWTPYHRGNGLSSAGADWTDYYAMWGSNTGLSTQQADWTSWYQMMGTTTDKLARTQNPTGFTGFWGRLISELGALEIRPLLDAESRAGAVTGILQRVGVEFPTVDPAITQAVVNGALAEFLRGFTPLTTTGPGTSTGGFSDVGLQLPLLFEIFDFATVDGDNVTVTVNDRNGQRFSQTFDLTGQRRRIVPDVVPGRVDINVRANNEGQFSPNTGQVNILSTVTRGNTTQQFNLRTGETGTLRIEAAPPRVN